MEFIKIEQNFSGTIFVSVAFSKSKTLKDCMPENAKYTKAQTFKQSKD